MLHTGFETTQGDSPYAFQWTYHKQFQLGLLGRCEFRDQFLPNDSTDTLCDKLFRFEGIYNIEQRKSVISQEQRSSLNKEFRWFSFHVWNLRINVSLHTRMAVRLANRTRGHSNDSISLDETKKTTVQRYGFNSPFVRKLQNVSAWF